MTKVFILDANQQPLYPVRISRARLLLLQGKASIFQRYPFTIHVLGNDTDCILRHQFILESQSVKSFRSGYSNAPCKEEEKEYAQVQ
jgi:hypothetical protein